MEKRKLKIEKPRKKIDKRPWGMEEIFSLNVVSSVKILHIEKGKRLSLQNHQYRGEFWKVLEGPVRLTFGKRELIAQSGEEFFIPVGKKHRAQALKCNVSILEISFGKFDEKDIKRFSDDFGRA